MTMTGPRMDSVPDAEPDLPSEFDGRLASDASAVIDRLQEMGWKLRGVTGCQVDDYKYDVEQVLRESAQTLTVLADRVREQYAPR